MFGRDLVLHANNEELVDTAIANSKRLTKNKIDF